MNLSDLRPCDKCGGKLYPNFYVIRASLAIFKPSATNQALGMLQFMGGNLGLAEMFTAEEPVTVAMDQKKGDGYMMNEIFLCQNCLIHPINLAEIIERRQEKLDSQGGFPGGEDKSEAGQ
jgi:hypothetical protein